MKSEFPAYLLYRICATRSKRKTVFMFFLVFAFQSVCLPFELSEFQKQAAETAMNEIVQCRFDRARTLADSMIAADSTEPLYWMLALCASALRQLDNTKIAEPDDFLAIYEKSKTMMASWDRCSPNRKSYMLTMKGFIQLVASAHTMQRNKYLTGLRLGLDAVSLCAEAKKMDSLNRDADLVIGLYNYARAELKKKFWGMLFWYSGDKQSGIETIRQCSRNAAIVGTTAAMILQEIYVRENMADSAAQGISRLLDRYPLCRFVLWTKVKLMDKQKSYKDAAQTYGKLSDAYESERGAYRSFAMTRLFEAQRYCWVGDNIRAKRACKRLLDSCKTESSEQCGECEKLLKKIAEKR